MLRRQASRAGGAGGQHTGGYVVCVVRRGGLRLGQGSILRNAGVVLI